MVYVERFLWIAAWSVWIWMGYGLYFTLPRNLGPVVATLPLQTKEEVVGFLGDTHFVVTLQTTPSGGRQRFNVYDIQTGERRALTYEEMARYRGPWKGTLGYLTRFSSPRRRDYATGSEQSLPVLQIRLPDGWATTTIIDNATGKVVWREWGTRYAYESVDESLMVLADGTIIRMPPPPNKFLFIVVQTILALPLVILWALLRWRKRRAALLR